MAASAITHRRPTEDVDLSAQQVHSAAGRNVLVLSGGTIAGQIALAIAIPLITRLYTPGDMGEYATFVALVGIFAPTVSLHYELAVPLARNSVVAARIASLATLVAIAFALLLSVCLLLLRGVVARHFGTTKLEGFLWLVPVSLIAQGFASVLGMWGLRYEAFSRMAIARGAQGIAQSSIQVFAGWLRSGASGLLIGQIGGQIAAVVPFVARTLGKPLFTRRSLNPSGLLRVARHHWRFPLVATWSSLVNSLTANLPVILLVSTFGPTVAGKFALSFRVLQLPVRLVGQSMSQVFLSRMAKARKDARLADAVEHSFRAMFLFVFPCFAILACIAPQFFAVAFGDAWADSGVYTQPLVPWMFFGFISTVLSMLVSVLSLQLAEIVFQLALLLVTVAALYAGHQAGSALIAIAVLGTAAGLILIFKILWLLHCAGVSLRRIYRFCGGEILRSAPAVAVVIAISTIWHNKMLDVVIGALTLAVVQVLNFHRKDAQLPRAVTRTADPKQRT